MEGGLELSSIAAAYRDCDLRLLERWFEELSFVGAAPIGGLGIGLFGGCCSSSS